jgi:hypothetical protein
MSIAMEELYQKYLDGTSSPEEEAILMNLIQKDNDRRYRILLEYLRLRENAGKKSLPEDFTFKTPRLKLQPRIWISAAAMLLILLSSGIFLITRPGLRKENSSTLNPQMIAEAKLITYRAMERTTQAIELALEKMKSIQEIESIEE